MTLLLDCGATLSCDLVGLSSSSSTSINKPSQPSKILKAPNLQVSFFCIWDSSHFCPLWMPSISDGAAKQQGVMGSWLRFSTSVQCAAAADNEELALGLEGGRSSLEPDCDEILVGNFHTGKTATSRKAAADCVGSRFRSLRCLCCRAWMEWDCTQGRVILRECRVFATLASPSPSSRLWWVSDICCWDLIQRRRLFRIWLFAFPKAVGRVYSEVHRPRLTNCLTTRGASWDCSLSAVQFENVYLEPGWILSKFCPYLSDRRPNCGVDTGLHGMDCGSVMKSTVDCNWGWGSRANETPPAHSHNRFQVSKALCFLGLEFLPCVTHTRVWDYY